MGSRHAQAYNKKFLQSKQIAINLGPKLNCVPLWLVGKFLKAQQRTEEAKSVQEKVGGEGREGEIHVEKILLWKWRHNIYTELNVI